MSQVETQKPVGKPPMAKKAAPKGYKQETSGKSLARSSSKKNVPTPQSQYLRRNSSLANLKPVDAKAKQAVVSARLEGFATQTSQRDSRNWKQLISQLNHTVGDIYYECERFNSLDRCNEAIKVFDEALTDLTKLKDVILSLDLETSSSSVAKDESLEDAKENADENKEASAPLTSWADIVQATERSSSAGLKERPPRVSWDRKRKTPEEILRDQEEKLAKAQKIRETNQSNIVAKAKNSTAKVIEKLKEVNARETKKRLKTQQEIAEKHERADLRHEAHVKEKRIKAEHENTKVKEITWINVMNVENKKLEIQQKLDDAEARRIELLEEEKKWRQDKRRLKRVCKFCECEIRSKDYLIGHLTSKQHKAALKKLNLDEVSANQDCIITIPLYPVGKAIEPLSDEERHKIKKREQNMKKRAKKLKAKMSAQAESFVKPLVDVTSSTTSAAPTTKSQSVKLVEDIDSTIKQKNYGVLDSLLTKLWRAFHNNNERVDEQFKTIKNISILVSILDLPLNSQGSVKVLKSVFDIIKLGIKDDEFKRLFFLSNQLEAVLEFILKHFSVKNYETLLGDAFKIISSLLVHFTAEEEAKSTMINTISLLLATPLLELIKQRWGELRVIFPMPVNQLDFNMALEIMSTLWAITNFVLTLQNDKSTDAKQLTVDLTTAFTETSGVGIILLMASILLQDGPLHKGKTGKRKIPDIVYKITFTCIKVLILVGELNLAYTQGLLGSDDNQVEFYHIVNYLLHYCTAEDETSSALSAVSSDSIHAASSNAVDKTELLQSLIVLVGQYVHNCSRNQETMQWGHAPTLLHRLCSLPFQFFTKPKLKDLLFPTLLVACHENKSNLNILKQEMSPDILVEYARHILDKDEPGHASHARTIASKFSKAQWTDFLVFLTESHGTSTGSKGQ